ncbi:hypothetical protein [Asaia sp. HumB]|uniref:hypothetical protein n=1 Tax=Asaia sp. HumB TaxID=3035475 RepID=UPI0025521B4F|nr:hypothetical protein [Asaia sp. HumB]MDL2172457.1 hypothetical protein [Asaia sp. HumB]
MGFPNKINYNWAVGFPGGSPRPIPTLGHSRLARFPRWFGWRSGRRVRMGAG